MKKRPRPSSSNSSTADALVSSTTARVSSLAGPSDDDVARLLALEVGVRGGWM